MPVRPRAVLLLLLSIALASCSGARNPASGASTPEAFGTTPEDPIRVAGLADRGPASERAYLDRLRGPNGEVVEYERTQSCCPFETPRGMMDTGMIDVYEVTYPGLTKPVLLYFNMYDPPSGALRAAEGFQLVE